MYIILQYTWRSSDIFNFLSKGHFQLSFTKIYKTLDNIAQTLDIIIYYVFKEEMFTMKKNYIFYKWHLFLIVLLVALVATVSLVLVACPAPQEEEETAGAEAGGIPEIPPATMTMLEEDVYFYFGFFTGSLVVVGDDGVLITDPSNVLRAQSLIEEIDKVTDLPVTTIALSHEHFDHIGGTELFPDATVVCHANCKPNFELDVLGLAPPRVDEEFVDFKEILVGDTVVELHHLGPGDGEAATVIYLPQEQVILLTDMYEPNELTFKNWVDDKHFTGTRRILNTVSEWDLKHVFTAHSPLNSLEGLLSAAAYYNDLYDAVKKVVDEAIAQGGPFAVYGLFDTLPQTLELSQYEDWVNYDTSFPRHVERMLLSIFHGD